MVVRNKRRRGETPISFDLDALARVVCGQSNAFEVQPLLFSFTIVLEPPPRTARSSSSEFAAMVAHIIVSAQISSLFPSAHAISTVLTTRRTDVPLPNESDSEHASDATVFHTSTTGTILLRVIHGGHIVELISLDTDEPPLRFVYPSPVLPHPALLLDDEDLHLMAVTQSGSLFRVVIPLNRSGHVWHAASSNSFGIRERIVARVKGSVIPQLAHIQGLQTVIIGISDGSLLKLETERIGNDGEDGAYRGCLAHGVS